MDGKTFGRNKGEGRKVIFQETARWVEEELKAGRNDTVHDFLAYLAEQMIEMNKVKSEEIKGFLKWLEREIGAEIDTLSNKTAIKEYHSYNFEQFLEVLKKNKKKISIDPSDRKKQELLEILDEYRNEYIPLIVPITLINHYVRKHKEEYLRQQVYLNPHPIALQLRNHA